LTFKWQNKAAGNPELAQGIRAVVDHYESSQGEAWTPLDQVSLSKQRLSGPAPPADRTAPGRWSSANHLWIRQGRRII